MSITSIDAELDASSGVINMVSALVAAFCIIYARSEAVTMSFAIGGLFVFSVMFVYGFNKFIKANSHA